MDLIYSVLYENASSCIIQQKDKKPESEDAIKEEEINTSNYDNDDLVINE